jgi:hypothetical protein
MEEMNVELERDLTIEDVTLAINQMAPLKSSGPNRFPAGFFQDNWAVVGTEVFLALNFFFLFKFYYANSKFHLYCTCPQKI